MIGRACKVLAAACLAAALAWALPAAALTAGPTCNGSNPTTGTPACGAAAGNPLNVMSGNKFQREVDMPPLPGVLGLEIVRYYNSEAALADERGILGRGWRLSYEAEAVMASDGSAITVHQGDGTQTRYIKAMVQLEPGATVYIADEPGQRSVRAQTVAGRRQYALTLPNGNTQTFDADGKLVQIAAPTGEFVTLQRDQAGFLVRVTDPQGRFLSLRHLANKDIRTTSKFQGVQHIDSPVGRFSYSYGSTLPAGSIAEPDLPIANLTKVALPTKYDPSTLNASGDRGTTTSTVTRVYHYENAKFPTLITGITVQGAGSDGKPMNERIVTWGYDERGRANLSVKGAYDAARPGPEQVTLDFKPRRPDGTSITVLTNSLGQTTRYIYTQMRGRPQLLEVRGAGCASCGPVNVRYEYDRWKRRSREVQLDAQGQTVSAELFEYDGVARLIRVDRVRYIDGKPGLPRMVVRYEYGPDPKNLLPTVIARQSVLPGKEHLVQVIYNEAGQPLTVTESGFSPLDDNGQPSKSGAPITRATRYSYTRINGRSVLSQVDGPLPNGRKGTPDDSDITRYDWDKRGNYVVGVVHPMGLKEAFDRDAGTGRVLTKVSEDGVAIHLEYTPAGRIARSERAGMVIARTYDAADRLSAMSDAAGRSVGFTHDTGGRATGVSDAQGYASKLTFDNEGKVLMAGLYEPQQSSPLRATYRWYDENNRLAKQLAPDGRIDTYAYNARGELMEHLDGDDVLHIARSNKLDTLHASLDLTPDGQVRAGLRIPDGTASTDTLRDDFGRVLVRLLPDHGPRLARYDVAGRIIGSADAGGTTWAYEYDAASRLIRRTATRAQGSAAQATPAELVTLHYAGARLARVEDSAQITAYAYDEAGRLAQTSVTLLGPSGGAVATYTTATTYDARSGLPVTETLADGSVLRLERDEQTQAAQRLQLQGRWEAWMGNLINQRLPGWMHWLQNLVPGATITSGIRFHPFNGITRYTDGNGVDVAKTFDSAGRLSRLSVGGHHASIFDMSYGYGVGPKIREMKGEDAQGRVSTASYRYDGFGALKGESASHPAGVLRTSSAGAVAKALRRDATGRTVDDGRLRYTYTAGGQVETVSDQTGKLVASYRYNSYSQRVSKTVYTGPQGQAVTTYFLWRSDKLVAEANVQGSITSQYLYLGAEGKLAPIAKLETQANVDNSAHSERILYIHTDHRGAPATMTDRAQRVVWQADMHPWGVIRLRHQTATLNLRMPGQYFDAETGLHDNFHRTYNPDKGRYLQPDPLGYPDGPEAYLYASGDPVNMIDPLGLYEEDVHYYLTYFLAVTAGLTSDHALIIAAANRYIDDNPYTEPYGTLGTNSSARTYYHFTQKGWDQTTDAPSRYLNPTNPQLTLLHGYATRAAQSASRSLTPCGLAQMYGEFLHAYEDTYAHRDQDNDPYGPTIGHLSGGHDPDKTFNHVDPLGINWQYNAARSLAMEQAVFNLFRADFSGATGASVRFADLKETLDQFNADTSSETRLGPKISILNAKLELLGLKKIPSYDCDIARSLRNANFIDKSGNKIQQGDYPGTILRTPTNSESCK